MPRWLRIFIVVLVLGLVFAPHDTGSLLSQAVNGIGAAFRATGLH